MRGKPLTFRTKGIGQPQDITLIPFYETHHERYSVYWKLMSEMRRGRPKPPASLAAK